MTAALFSLSRPDKILHRFKYLIHTSHVAVHEVLVVDLQKPMVFLILLQQPVTLIHVLVLLNSSAPRFVCLGNRRERLRITWLIFRKLMRQILLGKESGFSIRTEL